MRLREIHIKGFKSFAEGIRLRFEAGITGVVGPNGCGKSNFVDAMRWVLGEQRSKLLRADRMQQLIFNGTKDRKPLHLAEVSLSLSQTKHLLPTHHQELQITRRIYRSGESEYSINGIPSRLKDITDLMTDSGMSTDAYSIIELKMVEDILSNKESSRRQLFEHAAGIAKFKTQKKEALQKLSHAEADLKRIADLVHELDKNLSILKKQAEKSIQYKLLKERYVLLRSLEASAVSEQLEANKRATKDKLSAEEAAQRQLHSQLHQLEALCTVDKEAQEAKEKELQNAQRRLNEQQQQTQKLSQSLVLSQEKFKQLSQRIEELRHQIEKQTQQHQHSEGRMSTLLASLRQSESLEQAAQERLSETLTDRKAHQGALEELEEQLLVLTSLDAEQRATLQELSSRRSAQEAKQESLKQQQQQLFSEISKQASASEKLQQEQLQLRQKIQGLELQLEQLVDQEKEKASRLDQQRNKTEEARATLRDLKQKTEQQQAHIRWIEEMRSQMEGFPEAVQWLRSTAQLSAPLLMEVLEIEGPHALAIKMYLAPFAQCFITEKRTEAEEALTLLSREKKGQASFFVLEELPPLPAHTSSTEAVSAIDQVNCESSYQPLLERLLSDVWIARDSQLPAQLSTRGLVDAQAQWIYERGYLRGGQIHEHLASDAWGLRQRLRGLRSDLSQSQAEQQQLASLLSSEESTLSRMQESSLCSKIEETESLLRQLSQQEAAHQATRSQYEQADQSYRSTQQRILLQLEQLEAEMHQLHSQESSLRAKQLQTQKSLEALQSSLASARSTYQQSQDVFHQLQLAYTSQKSEKERLEAEYALHNDYLKVSSDDLVAARSALQQALEDLSTLQVEQAQVEEQLLHHQQQSEEKEKQVHQIEANYYELRHRLSEQEDNLRALEKKYANGQLIYSELQAQSARLEEELKHLYERFSTELGRSLQELLPDAMQKACEEQWDIKNSAWLSEQIESIKLQLHGLGTVNHLAAESFEEMEKRRSFIIQEQSDLLKARETIYTTLKQIEKTVHSRFMSAFEQINTHFQEVFRSLFSSEDVCSLRLVEKADEEEKDLDIIAQPKGKRPMRIEQLSSGEKALTAIALLMAIYLYKPSPFCILDEVDAPLDDANSDKFNQLIRKLSDRSQFILVTHNKRTMKNSDLLYGFTMPETGVTRILPVDLRRLSA